MQLVVYTCRRGWWDEKILGGQSQPKAQKFNVQELFSKTQSQAGHTRKTVANHYYDNQVKPLQAAQSEQKK